MDIIENMSGAISKVATEVAKGTNKVVQTSKLSLALIEKKDNLKTLYAKIGRNVVKCNNPEILEELEVTDIVTDAKSLYNEIVELKIKLSEIKNNKKCPDCGSNIPKNSAYCNICGSKII